MIGHAELIRVFSVIQSIGGYVMNRVFINRHGQTIIFTFNAFLCKLMLKRHGLSLSSSNHQYYAFNSLSAPAALVPHVPHVIKKLIA